LVVALREGVVGLKAEVTNQQAEIMVLRGQLAKNGCNPSIPSSAKKQ